MTRSKEYRQTTSVRYRIKSYRLFVGFSNPEMAKEVSDLVTDQWNAKFGQYRDAYLRMKIWVLARYPDLPKGQLGLYRSFLFKAMKAVPTGANPDDIIKEFEKKLGLKREVMEYILTMPGLNFSRDTEETTTNRTA